MLGQQVLHAVDAEALPLGAGKEQVAVTALRFPQPSLQHGACGLGKGCTAFFAALADHAHVGAGPEAEVLAVEPGHFG